MLISKADFSSEIPTSLANEGWKVKRKTLNGEKSFKFYINSNNNNNNNNNNTNSDDNDDDDDDDDDDDEKQ